MDVLETLSNGDLLAIAAGVIGAVYAVALTLYLVAVRHRGAPTAASESRKSRIYDRQGPARDELHAWAHDPEFVKGEQEHWDRVVKEQRDAREGYLDSLPGFPGVPAICPMCECRAEMPEYLPAGSFSAHSSHVFKVRRPGHLQFRCPACKYTWQTKTAAHGEWTGEDLGDGHMPAEPAEGR